MYIEVTYVGIMIVLIGILLLIYIFYSFKKFLKIERQQKCRHENWTYYRVCDSCSIEQYQKKDDDHNITEYEK